MKDWPYENSVAFRGESRAAGFSKRYRSRRGFVRRRGLCRVKEIHRRKQRIFIKSWFLLHFVSRQSGKTNKNNNFFSLSSSRTGSYFFIAKLSKQDRHYKNFVRFQGRNLARALRKRCRSKRRVVCQRGLRRLPARLMPVGGRQALQWRPVENKNFSHEHIEIKQDASKILYSLDFCSTLYQAKWKMWTTESKTPSPDDQSCKIFIAKLTISSNGFR